MQGYPWLFSSVLSVASHVEQDPYTFYYNPHPPVEFTAPGVDLEVAWLGGGRMVGTGNSFATPHIAGLVACILAKHRHLTPFQVKTVLYYTAKNVREALQVELQYFIDCILNDQRPFNDGVAGLRVVKLLEAADQSLQKRGRIVFL